MKKHIYTILSLLLVFVLCFSMLACSSDGADGADRYGNADASDNESADNNVVNNNTNRKIVYEVELEIESEDVESVYKTLSQKASSLGGYIQENEQRYDDGKIDNCYVVFRIPTDKLDEFLETAEGSGILTDKYVSTDDITTKYVNAQAKKQSLVERKAQLEALLNENITVTEKVNLISQISDVNAQIMQMELLINGYDSVVDYSTVTVEIDEKGVEPIVVLLIVLGIIVGVPCATVVIIVTVCKKARKSKKAE